MVLVTEKKGVQLSISSNAPSDAIFEYEHKSMFFAHRTSQYIPSFRVLKLRDSILNAHFFIHYDFFWALLNGCSNMKMTDILLFAEVIEVSPNIHRDKSF